MAGIRYVDTKRGALSWLHRSGHVLTVWNESPREARLVRPEPGVLAVYQHWRDGKATTEGHMGIVARTLDRVTFRDIEANTSAGTGEVVREGEGVLARVRTTDGTRAMHLKGFLCPWADIPSTTRVV